MIRVKGDGPSCRAGSSWQQLSFTARSTLAASKKSIEQIGYLLCNRLGEFHGPVQPIVSSVMDTKVLLDSRPRRTWGQPLRRSRRHRNAVDAEHAFGPCRVLSQLLYRFGRIAKPGQNFSARSRGRHLLHHSTALSNNVLL